MKSCRPVTIETINFMRFMGNVAFFNYRYAEKELKATDYTFIFSDRAGVAGALRDGFSYSLLPVDLTYCSLDLVFLIALQK